MFNTRRLLLALGISTLLIASVAHAEPLRGVLLEGEPDISILSHAMDGSSLALVGYKFNTGTMSRDPFIVVFNERTGEEIWRDESGRMFDYRAVAAAQNRVCAAGNPAMAGEHLIIRCYGLSDGTVLWTSILDSPMLNIDLAIGPDGLRLSGKALAVRVGGDPGSMSRGITLLFDPQDGTAK